MEKHKPYEQIFGHKEDFKVKYRFYKLEEGGRYILPNQGIRSDFWYEDPDHEHNWLFMIYPEFEDENGDLIEGMVNQEGIARMWILSPDNRLYHQQRIKVGTIGYFREGSKRTGICEIIELVGLHKNPVV
ncbi:hypothetical protein [Spirosoma utsteinense]|uniref:YopX protein domain-containing protein n=1 Tax=Spirosoma utsteinense TaxID=2585773 RepID=A0ABR6WE79_9BACT|nr:hypothetical protein [Spirosoma utsteinense]MBC3788821.1 hypothetical protein [Spirosoma utsteinense]MBC3794850.1 hypothetical protein [Spirosoma utsteinense]